MPIEGVPGYPISIHTPVKGVTTILDGDNWGY